MSECPNCGSADDHMPHGATCRTNEAVNEATYERDQLIRSLREELAVAKATLKGHELVCYGAMERGRDAERDQIADWHENEYEELARDSQCIEHDTGAPCDGCNGCLNHARAMSHLQAAQALRSNEHRSNT